MFHEAHKNQSIKDLYRNLNHLSKLTSQLGYLQAVIAGQDTIRVAYTTQGEPTATLIRDNYSVDNYSVLDHKLFQTICWTEAEAHYVAAILNSNELAYRAKPLCTTNWAKKIRDFHKHGWKLPIPRYEADDPLHIQLSQLGQAAEQECQALVDESEIMSKPAGKAQSDAARKLLRHEWQPNSKTAQAIEVTVANLLSDPKQSKLAEQQMQAE